MEAEGLQEAIVRAKVQALHPLLHLAPSCEHQYSRSVEPALHRFQNLGPILPGETQIEHHKVRSVLFRTLQSSLAIRHPCNVVTLKFQTLLQKQPQGSIIFNNQNPH
jgi:hypothetical protein